MRDDPDDLARLEEERAFLLASLDDLERERAAGDLGEDDYTTLRDGYTARAAEVLRAIDAGRAALPPPRRRLGRTLAVVALVLVAAGVAGWMVARGAGTRQAGETLTGGDTAETVNENLALARSLSSRNDPLPAIEAFDRVLVVEPSNVEALTYRGWLLARVGVGGQRPELVERGERSIDAAIAADPAYPDAQCFKAILRFRVAGDPVGARAPVDGCLAADPPPEVRALVEGLAVEITAATP